MVQFHHTSSLLLKLVIRSNSVHNGLLPGNPIVVAISLAALVFLGTVCFSEGVKMLSTS